MAYISQKHYYRWFLDITPEGISFVKCYGSRLSSDTNRFGKCGARFLSRCSHCHTDQIIVKRRHDSGHIVSEILVPKLITLNDTDGCLSSLMYFYEFGLNILFFVKFSFLLLFEILNTILTQINFSIFFLPYNIFLQVKPQHLKSGQFRWDQVNSGWPDLNQVRFQVNIKKPEPDLIQIRFRNSGFRSGKIDLFRALLWNKGFGTNHPEDLRCCLIN